MADAPRVVFTAQSKRYFYCREAICEFAFSRRAIPLNPFMAFGYFLADRTERDDVREANDAILSKCDELWVFGRELANGVLHEIAIAADAEMPIRFSRSMIGPRGLWSCTSTPCSSRRRSERGPATTRSAARRPEGPSPGFESGSFAGARIVSEHARPAARVLPPPIYLHFLDRELGEAYEFQLDLARAKPAFAALALGTASTLFCSISAILENPGLGGGEGAITDLVEAGALVPQSTHATLTEFLESRVVMYEHDRDRYPRYFGDEPLGSLESIEPRLAPPSASGETRPSTTERLQVRLEAWTQGESTVPSTTEALPPEPRRHMLDFVAAELTRRAGRAVTYAMFGVSRAKTPPAPCWNGPSARGSPSNTPITSVWGTASWSPGSARLWSRSSAPCS